MIQIIFLVAAVIVFLITTFGGEFLGWNLLALGLALFAASFLPFDRRNQGA